MNQTWPGKGSGGSSPSSEIGGACADAGWLAGCSGVWIRRNARSSALGRAVGSRSQSVDLMKAGKPAAAVVKDYEDFVQKRGFNKYMLYGPCHGIGMMEVERPWMESTSTYMLEKDMTFQVDTFFYDKDFGLRWENGVRVDKTGVERLSKKYAKIIEL